MVLHDFKNSHEKLLIKDDDYVVVGSYNWLSFEQERRGSYRRENALLVRDRRLISEQWEEYTKVMRPEAKTGD
jgi:phosphatidylserine/phosphatidylglycerophosphate/cardiolipin synthase-like enzyme